MLWLNRQDADGNNLFGGGFLGLDNISPHPPVAPARGATLEQADGPGHGWPSTPSNCSPWPSTSPGEDPVYDDLVITYFERFAAIARAINRSGIYDAEQGFFYDRMLTPDGDEQVGVESIGGAVPLSPPPRSTGPWPGAAGHRPAPGPHLRT